MKLRKIGAITLAAALTAAVPTAGTLSYAEIIANAGGGESVVENAPKLIVDGKEIAPDDAYDGYGPAEAFYSIKGNAAHTYKIEYKEGAVCNIDFACEDSETGADYSSELYLCEFSTTIPITLRSSLTMQELPSEELPSGVYGGGPLELDELSGDIASPNEYETSLYSLGSQTGGGSGSFVFQGPSKHSTKILTTVMEFKSESDGVIEFTVTVKNDSDSSSDSESTDKTVEIKDDATNISVSADKEVIPEDAKLTVSPVPGKTDANNFTYEITFKKGETEVQPNGAVTVKIPVPEAIKGKTIYVYHVEGGKYTDMNAKVENGFAVFTTDHFSEYLLTAEKHEETTSDSSDSQSSSDSESSADSASSGDSGSGSGSDSPDTGVAGISLTLGVIALAGAAVLVSKKKTR